MQIAQQIVQSAFEYFQERRLHNLSWQSIPVFKKPHSKKPQYLTVKKGFFIVEVEFPVFEFAYMDFCPIIAGHH